MDELEEEVRRAGASRVEMEGDARESLNRAKRLQGEVDMMRAEYEIISEEASGLRGSLAGAEVRVCCFVFKAPSRTAPSFVWKKCLELVWI